MLKPANKILSIVLSILLTIVPIAGQGMVLLANPLDSSLSPQNQDLQQLTDREMEGLAGRVRRVHTETVKVSRRGTEMVEGKPVLLEASTYDASGKKIDTIYHENPNAVPLTGQEKYKYDAKGNIVEMTLFDKDGKSILTHEKYEYEFDSNGNWTKMITYVAVITNGQIAYEKSEITHRTIAYYFDPGQIKTTGGDQLATNKPGEGSTTSPAASGTPSAVVTVPASEVPAGEAVAANKTGTVKTAPTVAAIPDIKGGATNMTVPGVTAAPVASSSNGNNAAPSMTFDAPPAGKIRPANYRFVQRSEGVLNSKAISLPKAVYPMVAKTMRITGTVSVEVSIDVTGRVVAAKAISGSPILHQAAVNAALLAKFTPTLLSGQPIRVTGIITYKFSPSQ
jgi:TonB family protein